MKIQIENLKQLIQDLPDLKLGRFSYKHPENGCMCAVGHILDRCNVLETVIITAKRNSRLIRAYEDTPHLVGAVLEKYHLTLNQLQDIQCINDNSGPDEDRNKLIADYLEGVLNSLEIGNENNHKI